MFVAWRECCVFPRCFSVLIGRLSNLTAFSLHAVPVPTLPPSPEASYEVSHDAAAPCGSADLRILVACKKQIRANLVR
jgi:hypothetical protein